jgi:hypothetical protein
VILYSPFELFAKVPTRQLLLTGEQPLFLGMHYLKSATYGFEPDSRKFEKASKNQNCHLLDDGSIKAMKKISPNLEMLLLETEEDFLSNVIKKEK